MGEEEGGVQGDNEKGLESDTILRGDGIGKSVEEICDPSVSLVHAKVRHHIECEGRFHWLHSLYLLLRIQQ